MHRTKSRALASGKISVSSAFIFASLLALVGFGSLLFFAGWPAFLAAVWGYVIYIFVYAVAKRRSVHGTLIGSLAGATPPLVGYLAVRGTFDTGAALIFLAMTCWQMSHFYAIAIYRDEDYAAAKIPVMPLVKGFERTKQQMTIYTLAFIIVSLALSYLGYSGLIFAFLMTVVGIWWLKHSLVKPEKKSIKIWAKQEFKISLQVLLIFCFALSLDSFIAK